MFALVILSTCQRGTCVMTALDALVACLQSGVRIRPGTAGDSTSAVETYSKGYAVVGTAA